MCYKGNPSHRSDRTLSKMWQRLTTSFLLQNTGVANVRHNCLHLCLRLITYWGNMCIVGPYISNLGYTYFWELIENNIIYPIVHCFNWFVERIREILIVFRCSIENFIWKSMFLSCYSWIITDSAGAKNMGVAVMNMFFCYKAPPISLCVSFHCC